MRWQPRLIKFPVGCVWMTGSIRKPHGATSDGPFTSTSKHQHPFVIMQPDPGLSRRQFLGSAIASTAVGSLLTGQIHAEDPPPPTPKIDRKIKLGLIGCGGRGAWLGGFFQQHGGFEIHATADYFQDQADKAGDALGVDKARRFSGFRPTRRLLESGVEAVTVVNIPRFHAEHARAAIEAGLPCVCRQTGGHRRAGRAQGAGGGQSWPPRRNSCISSTIRCPPTR